jgi:sulfur relay (sulfurtransferase) complex TusBCD TusD component (DsrE family)
MKPEDVPECMDFDDRPVVECSSLAELEAVVDSILSTGNRRVKLKFPPTLFPEAYDILSRLFLQKDSIDAPTHSRRAQEEQEVEAQASVQAQVKAQEAQVVRQLTPVSHRGLVYVIEQHGQKYWAKQDLGQAGTRLLWDFSFDDLADAELHARAGLDMILDPGEPPS